MTRSPRQHIRRNRQISLAVFRLMIHSNFIGCSTGRSAGLATVKILSSGHHHGDTGKDRELTGSPNLYYADSGGAAVHYWTTIFRPELARAELSPPSAAPEPRPHTSRARKRLPIAPAIFDFRLPIFDCRRRRPEIGSKIFLSCFCLPEPNPKSKIENLKFSE